MSYQHIFQEILAESAHWDIGGCLNREITLTEMPRKAQVLMGVRRCGKSTILAQIAAASPADNNKIFVNFSDERLSGLLAKDLRQMFEAYLSLYPEKNLDAPTDLYLDELQLVSGWEAFVDRQLRVPKRRIFITGSSSKLLSKEIASQMRGRSVSAEIFPFSFIEYLKWHKVDLAPANRTEHQSAKIGALFDRYLTRGGFPETISLDAPQAVRVEQEYFEILLLRDIIERHRASRPIEVRRFLEMLLRQFAQPMTINKSCEKLKAQGISINKTNLSEMLGWFEDAYCVFSVPILSESIQKQNTNPRKIYVIDNGLLLATQVFELASMGRLLENLVYVFFRSRQSKINYHRNADGTEVDFVIDAKELFQVCYRLEDSGAKDREIRGLRKAMAEFGRRRGTILTHTETAQLKVPEGIIEVIPTRELLLSPRQR